MSKYVKKFLKIALNVAIFTIRVPITIIGVTLYTLTGILPLWLFCVAALLFEIIIAIPIIIISVLWENLQHDVPLKESWHDVKRCDIEEFADGLRLLFVDVFVETAEAAWDDFLDFTRSVKRKMAT